MIHTELITIAGRETLLLIVPPNWTQPVRAGLLMDADVDEAVTGIQERRPRQSAPRIQLQYLASLSDAQLQQIRSVLGGLKGKAVAIPFWPDVLNTDCDPDGTERSNWNARLLDAQINVGWDADFQNVMVAEGGAAPARSLRGALMIGRLSRVSMRAVTDAHADWVINFTEDSPWSCRVEPRAGDPSEWSQDWQPDWSIRPEQSQRVLMDYRELGRSRESAAEGTADVLFWRQTARLTLAPDSLADLIAFYVARRGAVEAFTLPSSLQPGNATPTGPHTFEASNGRVRFSDKDLRIEWTMPLLATVSVPVEQQIETTDQSQTPAAFAFLYRFTYEGELLTVTDWESPIMAAGSTWEPARIEHGRLRQSLRPQNEDCEIDAYIEDVPLIDPFVRLEVESPASIEIFEMLLPSGTPQLLFVGSIQKARVKGKRVKLKAAAFSGALDRRVPRFQWSISCNHTLFSHGCVRRRQTQMARENWRAIGFFEAQWADPKLLLNSVTYPGPTPADHYYVGGWVETGSGTARQVREILGSWHVSGTLHLLLARPIRTDQLSPGQAFHVYPGCDGQYSSCSNKFSNTENFGGFPFMPEWIEQAPASYPKTGK